MIVRRRAVLLAAGLIALAVLIFLVMRASAPPGADTAVHHWLLGHRHPWSTDLALVATTAGGSVVLYPAATVVILVVWWRQRTLLPGRRWRRPMIALVVLALGTLLRTVLSDLLHRARPPRGDWLSSATGWSMPSGHSANAAMAAVVVLWSVWPFLRTPASQLWSVAAGALFAVAVGWSRAYLGVHWPTDVVAGWLFAGCWTWLALWIAERIAPLRIPAPQLQEGDPHTEHGPQSQHAQPRPR